MKLIVLITISAISKLKFIPTLNCHSVQTLERLQVKMWVSQEFYKKKLSIASSPPGISLRNHFSSYLPSPHPSADWFSTASSCNKRFLVRATFTRAQWQAIKSSAALRSSKTLEAVICRATETPMFKDFLRSEDSSQVQSSSWVERNFCD